MPDTPTRESTALEMRGHADSEETLTSHGQRWTNRLWETTQAAIALLLVGAVVWCAVTKGDVPEVLAAMAGGASASYFQRTNSHRVGGVERHHEGR